MLAYISTPHPYYPTTNYYGYRRPIYGAQYEYLRAVIEAQAARERYLRMVAAEEEMRRQRQLRAAYERRRLLAQLMCELGNVAERCYYQRGYPIMIVGRQNEGLCCGRLGNGKEEAGVEERTGLRRQERVAPRRCAGEAVDQAVPEREGTAKDEEQPKQLEPTTSTLKSTTNTTSESKPDVLAPSETTSTNADVQPSISADVAASLKAISDVEDAFQTTQSSFVFPETLDFDTTPASPALSVRSTTSHGSSLTSSGLTYAPTNAPVRQYEHALNGLLTKLDGVESYGSEEVRKRRKEVVAKIEGALEEVEREVEARLEAKKMEEASMKEERGIAGEEERADLAQSLEASFEPQEAVNLGEGSTESVQTMDEIVQETAEDILDDAFAISRIDPEVFQNTEEANESKPLGNLSSTDQPSSTVEPSPLLSVLPQPDENASDAETEHETEQTTPSTETKDLDAIPADSPGEGRDESEVSSAPAQRSLLPEGKNWESTEVAGEVDGKVESADDSSSDGGWDEVAADA